jgi:cellobiose phosphorylase
MYRIGLEAILGFQLRGKTLFLEPCVPAQWSEFTIEYRFGSTVYVITVANPDGLERGGTDLVLDGRELEGGLPLVDDGRRHEVTALMRPSSALTQTQQAAVQR